MSLRPRRWFSLAVAFIALIFFVDHVLISRAAPTQQVWINEFMPRPNTGGKEWVELFNPNPIAVDLTGWKIIGMRVLRVTVAFRWRADCTRGQL
jgi:hypothetical protein